MLEEVVREHAEKIKEARMHRTETERELDGYWMIKESHLVELLRAGREVVETSSDKERMRDE